MRILHLHWGFPPIIGGVETHLSMMLPVMARSRHRVSLITGSVEGMKLNYAFHGAKQMLTLIDGGHWLGVLLIQGAVMGWWGLR